MKTNISLYLDKVIKKSNNEINRDFDFLNIDRVNIFLTKQVLERECNLWFKVNNEYLNKFYEAIIFVTSVYFFEKNYCEDKETKPKKGDKYKNKRRQFKVLSIEYDDSRQCEIVKLQGISRGNSAIVSLNLKDLDDSYTKLSDNATKNTRASIEQPMFNFCKKTLNITEQIPSFPHKFAIVTQKNDFKNCFMVLDKKIFPYIYIADSGHETPNLPLADCMFYVALSYETIKTYIFDEDIKVESLIFIGNKYNHQIQQDINREYFKRAIFVGEQEPDVECLKWRWTLPEYQYFENLIQGEVKITEVKNVELTQLTQGFINYIQELEKDYYVDLKRLFAYISYTYPLVVLTDNSRLQNRVEDLLHSFKIKSEQILGEEFSSIGEDCTEIHQQLVRDYGVILKQFNWANNAKTKALKQQKETNYLLVPERQTLEVWKSEIKKLNWQKVKIISFRSLKTIPKQSNITVLSIKDYDFYCHLKNSNHHIYWLLYDQEQRCYDNFTKRYDNELTQELNSKDRKKLTGIEYPNEIKTEGIDDLIGRIWGDETHAREHTITYQDHIDKKIVFTDNTAVELSANSSVIWINNKNKPRKYKVADLTIGDKIRIYENHHKEVLFDSIIQNDTNGKFNKILECSELWKKILTDYCADDKTGKINEIADLCDVVFSTVEGWLKKSKTKFPKNIKPLISILGVNYGEIYQNNKHYNSIMIALGRDLSDEVSDYIIRKQKGELLSKFDDVLINKISEHNMPIKTIKKIEIIDRNR